MTRSDLAFFRNFLKSFFESAFVHGQIDSNACERIKSWLRTRGAEESARLLFRDRMVDAPAQLIRLQLKTLREMNGKRLRHIEVIAIPDASRPRRKCFVGHRFSQSVERTLRWNLRQVLEPYNVELEWSGRSLRSVQILDDILEKIRAADFCVFDNRATRGRPNVYVEAGMCIALKKPFILFEYEPRSYSSDRPEAIPSDLRFALTLRYRNYEQLFRHFYFRLPTFIAENF